MAKKAQKSAKGSSTLEVIIVIVVVALLGIGGWLVWQREHSSEKAFMAGRGATAPVTSRSSPPVTVDPHAGWKTGTSLRASFSIRYPANWSYSESLGSKDGVEHISLDTAAIHLAIDSYSGKDVATGGQPATTCTDCAETANSADFTIHGLGTTALRTVIYNLDAGKGNALILTLPDSTYYIPSPDRPNVYTSFRAISNLSSEQAYQAESLEQFTSNVDYATAKQILESVSY